ncbi:MAG TPA: TIGR03557 family F420-dependent LLM class oxidoreductase [Sporichthya sp.]|nr:TIGR03557 family F420-dependent LLM class oxidoreductase [Sporichthya sp.]
MTTFGYFLSAEELAPREIVTAGQFAERAGFSHAWISDHYHPWQESQGQSPFVWSVLGALATTTELQLTTAVTCPTFRIHPAVMAQAAATTAVLAPGRFRFGVGSGEALNEHILGEAWPPVSIRLERLEEAIEVMRRLWTGEVVTHQGRYYTVHNARIFTLPDQEIPVLISGFGPEATDFAARIGDGWMTTSPDADGLTQFKQKNQGVTQAGVKICWAPSEDEAKETAFRLWSHSGIGGQASQDVPMWHTFESIGEANTPDKLAEKVACGPDPGKAAANIREYIEAGFDEIYIAQMGSDQEGGIRFITDEVLPLL